MLEHVKSSLVNSDEGSVVELSESEESHDSFTSGVDMVNTILRVQMTKAFKKNSYPLTLTTRRTLASAGTKKELLALA